MSTTVIKEGDLLRLIWCDGKEIELIVQSCYKEGDTENISFTGGQRITRHRKGINQWFIVEGDNVCPEKKVALLRVNDIAPGLIKIE